MSNTDSNDDPVRCESAEGVKILTKLKGRKTVLGNGLPVHRLLPTRDHRAIGPWCFLDHIGPATLSADASVDVGTHPHIGLQTVTWLYEGRLLHKDSLGYQQAIRPHQLNLMTAGRGICHSEESPEDFEGPMHGLQFWIASPTDYETIEPRFAHHDDLPTWSRGVADITLIVGELEGRRSPAEVFSPLVGADLVAREAGDLTLTIPASFEMGLCIVAGEVEFEEQLLGSDELWYAGRGREELTLSMRAGSRVMLLGGEPLDQPMILWWNFVASSRDRLVQAERDWRGFPNDRFPDVEAYSGSPLETPALDPERLKDRR